MKKHGLKAKDLRKFAMVLKSNPTLIRKAIAVSADQGDYDVSSYLPAPLALQVIDYIRDINIMRRLISVFVQNARVWKKPKRASGMSAYYIPDGVQATESGFTSTSVTWTAKKLMSYTVIDEETIEDSQPDVLQQVLQDFAAAVAEAEEKLILEGDTTHTATAPDPSSATTNNWYVRDARLAFDGIFTAAAGGSAATAVDGNNTAIDCDMVNKALYNLGKYGRNKSRVVGLLPSDQAANVRANSEFRDAAKAGLPFASFVTGMGSAGEADALVTKIFGVNFYEVPFGPAGHAVMFHRDSPSMGDRRRIKLASDVVVEQDQRKYVVSERVSFNFDYLDALVLIDALSQTIIS